MASKKPNANEYIQEKQIRELFQALTLGLVHHRPTDHLEYMLDCLKQLKKNDPGEVTWDAFLPRSKVAAQSWRGGQHLGQAKGMDISRNGSHQSSQPSTNSGHCTKSENDEDIPASQSSGEQTDQQTGVQDSTAVSRPATVQHVLQGSLSDLPPIPTNTVRIFLSSTFTDFKAERTILPREAYPELHRFCSELGLDFQVVDMRWGVTDEAINDHMTSFLCLREIATCQMVSCGPNFVTLLGNKYGSQPLPVIISVKEWDHLTSVLRELKHPGVDLLNDWYLRDENASPAVYLLQPISSKLPHFNDIRPENAEKRSTDKKTWNQTLEKLQDALRCAAAAASEAGKLSQEDRHKYFMSVTEEEIQHGLISTQDVTERALCYVRNLKGIVEKLDDSWAHRFIDKIEPATLDQSSHSLLTQLVEEKVPKKLEGQNIRQYETEWTGEPLENSNSEEHEKYLKQFCKDFVADMKDLIVKSIEKQVKFTDKQMQELYLEVLHHSRFARVKTETFCGREDIVKPVITYITEGVKNSTSHAPFILYGKSGFGKTSIMAHVASSIQNTIGTPVTLLMRFLGTSAQSSSIKSMLVSIIYQICFVYKIELPDHNISENMGDLRRFLWKTLEDIQEQTKERPLIIMLDSLDQLARSHGAYKMLWLPRSLHGKIFMVASVVDDPRYEDLMQNLQKRVCRENFVEVTTIPESTGDKILSMYMMKAERSLTYPQEQLVLSAFNKCNQALYLKLLIDNAKTWQSYTEPETIRMAQSVHEAIEMMFKQSEDKYGKVFVGHGLGYLTAGKEGLSAVELEDVLSCDDEVLNEVYQYHDPPVEGIVRIPSLLWARLQFEVSEYIVERQADGKAVMAWYHRQFWEAAEKRYLPPGQRQKLHSSLADMYRAEHGIRKTIILHKRKNKVIENADRQITPQPLTPRNLRKLNSLPYHMIQAERLEELKSDCVFNFKWMLTKLVGLSAAIVLSELEGLTQNNELRDDEDIARMLDFIKLSFQVLQEDPRQLASQVIERFRASDSSSSLVQQLVSDSVAWVLNEDQPLLMPTHSTDLQSPDSPLRLSLLAGYKGQVRRSLALCSWNEQNTSRLLVWNLQDKDKVASIETSCDVPVAISQDAPLFAYADGDQVYLCDLESGDVITKTKYLSNFKREFKKMDVRAIALSSDGNKLAIGAKFQVPRGAAAKTWKHVSCMFVVDLQQETSVMHEFNQKQVQNHIDKMFITPDGTRLVTLFFGCIVTSSFSGNLSESIQMHKQCSDLQADTFHMYIKEGEPYLIGGFGGQFNGKAKILIFNMNTTEHEISENVHIADTKGWPFSVQANENLSKIAVGTLEDGKNRNNGFCIWDREAGVYTKMQLDQHENKFPRAMCLSPDWTMALIGWEDGDVTVLHFESAREIYRFKSHDRGITSISLNQEQDQYIILSWDHALKLWDVERLSRIVTGRLNNTTKSEDAHIKPYLYEGEQCVAMTATDQYAITAPPEPIDSPKFWRLEDGTLQEDFTNKLDVVYKEQNDKLDKKLRSGRKMAEFTLIKNETILVDVRKSRNACHVWVIDTEAGEVILNRYVSEIYRILVTASGLIFLVADKLITIRDVVTWEEQKTIPMPELPPLLKNSPPKGYLTSDDLYLVLINSIPPEKCLYVVDIKQGKLVANSSLPDTVPLYVIEDGTYFVTIKDSNCVVLSPRELADSIEEWDYKSLVAYTTYQSKDFSIGAEFCQDHSVNVWQFTHKLGIRSTLKGHKHQVRCITFSKNNRYAVTGSFDNTIRVWSTDTGDQLCMYHTSGAVDHVLFARGTSFIVVHCYAAPKRKRVLVFKTHNLE